MSARERGLYERLVTQALEAELTALPRQLRAIREELREAEASDRIALHVQSLVRIAVASLPEKKRLDEGIRLTREIVQLLSTGRDRVALSDEALVSPAQVLRAIARMQPDGEPERIAEPLIPLLDTALLTNAPGEPRVGSQVVAEVPSADRIDVVMAFIRLSGIRSLLATLRRHCEQGGAVRVLTTTYTNSTQQSALEALRDAGADVRVSYDTSTTRLHAKAWLFHRESGYSTAYVGSSNLTRSAQVTGLEWNVRVSGARNPDVIDKIGAVFETYWHGGDFVPFEAREFAVRSTPPERSGPTTQLSPIELRPYAFQERLLEQIHLAREQGRHRNLLVAATGTGKTVMAALDYVRLHHALPRARLLFVAHRREILEQSLLTFRHALRDHAFGELWVGSDRPARFEHVFASVQNLRQGRLADIDPRHFDVVVIDEFHHAAAPTYTAVIDHLQPRELLGLTATPERGDGRSVLSWFGGEIAAELRLWDAIDQQRLCPFVYYGVHDGLDLRDVPWRRGRGYDQDALSNVLTGNDAWAAAVVAQLDRHVDDHTRMRALGFCVSVEHAHFMAATFDRAGIRAVAVSGATPQHEREHALRQLAAGDVQVVFSVDLFNEGVDVPDVDTLLLLRPTDSATLFLQQLGRGLRRSDGKAHCTVLDFVGQHRREFRFDRRLRALLGGTRKQLTQQVERGFPFLPAGCHMELDAVASRIVLDNLRKGVPSNWRAKVEELRALAATDVEGLALDAFLEHSGLELEDLYQGNKCWSDLRDAAGLPSHAAGAHERALRRGIGRMLHVDDLNRIDAYRRMLAQPSPPQPQQLPERDRRLLRMLTGSLLDSIAGRETTLAEGAAILWEHPQVRAELHELLDVLARRIDHVQRPLASAPDVPLKVHARYTRIEILAAFGDGDGDRAKVTSWQQGVRWARRARADLLAFTLDKTHGQFSPTTRYRDYAISRELIHWESQSVTRADSETGRRYQNHEQEGSSIMLFARLRADERAFWFLGPANYVRHESEQPMAITWRLETPLPADLFAAFAAAVA